MSNFRWQPQVNERHGAGPSSPLQPWWVLGSSGRFLTVDHICVALNFRWQPQVTREVVLVPASLPSTAGCLSPAELFSSHRREGSGRHPWGAEGSRSIASAEGPSHCEGRAQLVRCAFTSTQDAALLRESSRSLIAQASSPTPPPMLCSQPKHRRAQRAAKSTFPAKSLPSPPSLTRCRP